MESRPPELRLQSDVGDGAVAEHPVTRVTRACRGTPERVGRRGGEPVARAAEPRSRDAGTLRTAGRNMRAADARPANMRPADMRPTDMRPTDMRTHPTAAVMSAKAVAAAVSAAAVPAAVSAATVSAATVSAATAARVCFECEKRHDEE